MVDRDAKTVLFEQFARVGKAVASGKRLELLDLLAQGERTVDALARAAGLGLTTASAHLQTLKQANLVTTRRDGTKIYYRLAGDDVAALYALVQAVAGEHLADVAAARATYLGPETDEVTREELLRRGPFGRRHRDRRVPTRGVRRRAHPPRGVDLTKIPCCGNAFSNS